MHGRIQSYAIFNAPDTIWYNPAAFDVNEFLDHTFVFIEDPAALISQADLDRGFMLSHPYPNPATGSAWITYQLPSATIQASLRVTDLKGHILTEQMIDHFEARGTFGRMPWQQVLILFSCWLKDE